jgi:hypothetical protein
VYNTSPQKATKRQIATLVDALMQVDLGDWNQQKGVSNMYLWAQAPCLHLNPALFWTWGDYDHGSS